MTTTDAIAHANSFFKSTLSGSRAADLSSVSSAAEAQREKTARLRAQRLQSEAAAAQRSDRAVAKGRLRSRILAGA